jgi:hypothetical protein
VLSSTQESNDALVAPLLRTDSGGGTGDGGDLDLSEYSSRQDTMEVGGVSSDPRLMSVPPIVRQVFTSCMRIRTAADALPKIFYDAATNGKTTAIVFVGVYVVIVVVWLPFWLLSFIVSEWGVYLLAVAAVFFVGRSVIRMIAFPGASRRVTGEMEAEFARYSVRMILSATHSLIELVSVVSPESGLSDARRKPDIPGIWRYAKTYRDRVLGVYLEVLLHLYGQPPSPSDGADVGCNKYGNNRLNGDVGDLSGLTVRQHSRCGVACVGVYCSHDRFIAASSCGGTRFDGSPVHYIASGRRLRK